MGTGVSPPGRGSPAAGIPSLASGLHRVEGSVASDQSLSLSGLQCLHPYCGLSARGSLRGSVWGPPGIRKGDRGSVGLKLIFQKPPPSKGGLCKAEVGRGICILMVH